MKYIEIDEQKAAYYFEKAGSEGGKGFYSLGIKYIENDEHKAVKYFEKAGIIANKGFYSLGMKYIELDEEKSNCLFLQNQDYKNRDGFLLE